MCGLRGIICRIEPGDSDRVRESTRLIAHRGPDDEGLWSYETPDGSFGAVLGHRRLAIIDLRHSAAQPMIDPGTGTALVFNGEIYNFLDLRAELEALGERFVTDGDSEVILRGYARWGDRIVERLRGMFAFVIVDPRAGRALLARDGYGIKPLYTCEVRDAQGVRAIAFASEGRALVKAGFAAPVTEPRRLYQYLWNGFSSGPSTIWRDIDELPRGSLATLDGAARTLEPKRFWVPGHGKGSSASAAEMIDESIRLHLVSDVPKVIFLSGGIDSTALVGVARRYETRLETMSLGFAEQDYDETRFAQQIAKAAGTRHHSIHLTAAEMLASLDRSIASLDQPSFDGTNTWLVSRAAAELGFKVGLSGAGGDELAGGYTSFQRLPKLARLLSPPFSPLAVFAARAAARISPRQAGRRKLVDLARTQGNLAAIYQTQYALRSQAGTLALMADRTLPYHPYGLTPGRLAELDHQIEGLSPARAVSVLESEMFLGDRLLRDSDTVSMDNSIELRVPFVDTCLSDGFDGLSDAERYQPFGNKPPLRRIAYDTAGQTLMDRPKRGFELPIERWLHEDLRATVDATLLDRSACDSLGLSHRRVAHVWDLFQTTDLVYWTRIWTLFVLLRWAAINGISAA
jgi:asparagine synthase (glutamine-hydrolysing)